ncbi:MAG: peptidoglycan-binding protein [Microgenomates group bacterium]
MGDDPVATLQQLLVMVGAYPGRVDGNFGNRTKRAVEAVLGYRGRNLSVFEAIVAMDEFLCSLKN